MESITEIENPRTGENYTLFDAQRILRADFKRRAKNAKRVADWMKRRQNGT
jgi:hypothetical protein